MLCFALYQLHKQTTCSIYLEIRIILCYIKLNLHLILILINIVFILGDFMISEFLTLMTELFKIYGVQIVMLSSPGEIEERFDYGFRKYLFNNFSYSSYAKELFKNFTPGTLYNIEDDFCFFYSIFLFPESFTEYSNKYIFVGPVLIGEMTSSKFENVIKENNINPDLRNKLAEFYHRMPVYSSLDKWIASLSLFLSKITKSNMNSSSLTYKNKSLSDIFPENISIALPESSLSRNTIEARYKAEEELMLAVAAGNTEKALLGFSNVKCYKMLPRTPDAVRNTKNTLVILNVLLRKAVQRSHIHPIYIDNLSRQLAIKIESSSSLSVLESMPNLMIRKYCLLVKNHSRASFSSLVQFCLDYIDFHYAEDMSLSILAAKKGVSKSYLASLFHSETGCTVTDYIFQTRIDHSIYLLNTTKLSISNIALNCGFSDPNYFSRIFKKLNGKSPRSYREIIGVKR